MSNGQNPAFYDDLLMLKAFDVALTNTAMLPSPNPEHLCRITTSSKKKERKRDLHSTSEIFSLHQISQTK